MESGDVLALFLQCCMYYFGKETFLFTVILFRLCKNWNFPLGFLSSLLSQTVLSVHPLQRKMLSGSEGDREERRHHRLDQAAFLNHQVSIDLQTTLSEGASEAFNGFCQRQLCDPGSVLGPKGSTKHKQLHIDPDP